MSGNGSIPTLKGRGGKGTSRWLLAAGAVLVLTLAASCGGASGNGGGQKSGGGGQEASPKGEQAVGIEPLGDADAPVVLTEYADYQ